ncbi:nucleoporin NDC1-like isoform X2 [Dermacentor variabilis]|uniref:nucleoporin NDC1-like isoform X2 n=1 Tax=Dermacentor variabilis TaxID=34621 RepID=UPI003F5BD665
MSKIPAEILRLTKLLTQAKFGDCKPNPWQMMSPAQPPPPPAPPKLSLANRMLAAVKSKPLVTYFISELSDVKSRQLFADCQPLIWAIEGLCLLACASKTEDQYGVVQFSLPSIFTALLELDQRCACSFWNAMASVSPSCAVPTAAQAMSCVWGGPWQLQSQQVSTS